MHILSLTKTSLALKMSKRKRMSKKHTKNLTDVTINDFANATVIKNRPKKSNVRDVIKEMEVLTTDDNKGWDERNEEELDGDFVETVNDDGSVSYTIKPRQEKKKKNNNNTIITNGMVESVTSGNVYPMDVWYLIGKYIKPEDVGRFASICKSSYAVVSRSKFWIDLYNRYYSSNLNIPDDLSPKHLARRFGIRTTTVRALYHMYRPFVDRLVKMQTFEMHPDYLLRRKCVSVWHQKCVGRWCYYFMLEEHHVDKKHHDNKVNLIEALDDVYANPDERCKLLVITSTGFSAIAPVHGCILRRGCVTLMSTLQKYKFVLKFTSTPHSSLQATDGSNLEVSINNVVNYKIFDWWHPQFPRSNTLDVLLDKD